VGQVIARNYASPASDDPLAAIRTLIEGVRFAADSALEEVGFELVVPDFRETFFLYIASEPETGREPQPVLTTDNGRLPWAKPGWPRQ